MFFIYNLFYLYLNILNYVQWFLLCVDTKIFQKHLKSSVKLITRIKLNNTVVKVFLFYTHLRLFQSYLFYF